MGNRGAYGFRIDGQEKVTYEHGQSYPESLGKKVLLYLAKTPIDQIKQVAKKIILVNEHEDKPTIEQIEKYKKYSNLEIGENRLDCWRNLLYYTRSNLSLYHLDVEHMIDYSWFLGDSLFCEWGYIINLDNETLEVYVGFNKNPNAHGRYAFVDMGDDCEYAGVSLEKEIRLTEIKKRNVGKIIKELEKLGRDEE